MAIQTDMSVAVNGDIRYTWTTANYTVLELHRFLQGLADDSLSSWDDLLDITDTTPSKKQFKTILRLLPPYNIDDTLAQHLYEGSITQKNWDEIYDWIVNYWTQWIHIEIVQNGALVTPNFWTTWLNANVNAWISHRFLIKVRTWGADIDWRRLLWTTREFWSTYWEFLINGSERWNNTLALTNATDLNNATLEATVATWTTITNTEWYRAIDVNNDWTTEPYYSEWDRDTFTINQLHERSKWLTRRWTTSTLYGLNGDLFRWITHEIVIDTPTWIFNATEPISWTWWTWQMLAIDSVTAWTKMWIQLLTWIAPIDNDIITWWTSSATATINLTIIVKTIQSTFLWTSTGSALIWNYWVWVEALDLTSADKLTDLNNVLNLPPNLVTFILNWLIAWANPDSILITPWDWVSIDWEWNAIPEVDQLSASGTYVWWETTFTVVETIPLDTPTTWTIRIYNWVKYTPVTYTWYNGSDFTWCTWVPITSNLANVWISYIDKGAWNTSESFTSVYVSDRQLVIRVRNWWPVPIETFVSTATLWGNWWNATVVRSSDL